MRFSAGFASTLCHASPSLMPYCKLPARCTALAASELLAAGPPPPPIPIHPPTPATLPLARKAGQAGQANQAGLATKRLAEITVFVTGRNSEAAAEMLPGVPRRVLCRPGKMFDRFWEPYRAYGRPPPPVGAARSPRSEAYRDGMAQKTRSEIRPDRPRAGAGH